MTEVHQGWLFDKDEQRRLDLSQFYTPAWLAERMWARMSRPALPHPSVLEPSAGRGSLVLPMLQSSTPQRLVVYDCDPRNVLDLRELLEGSTVPQHEVRAQDFLADPDPGFFDLAFMNPPYEDDQDVAHLDHAISCSFNTCALVRSAFVHGQNRWQKFWRHVDIKWKANLIARPEFSVPVGGKKPKGAMSDFIVISVQRRQRARLQGEVSTQAEEWW